MNDVLANNALVNTFDMIVSRLSNVELMIQSMYSAHVPLIPRDTYIDGRLFDLPCQILKDYDGKQCGRVIITMTLRPPASWHELLKHVGLSEACKMVACKYDNEVLFDRGGFGSLVCEPMAIHSAQSASKIVIEVLHLLNIYIGLLSEIRVMSVDSHLIHDVFYYGNMENWEGYGRYVLKTKIAEVRTRCGVGGLELELEEWRELYSHNYLDKEIACEIEKMFEARA